MIQGVNDTCLIRNQIPQKGGMVPWSDCGDLDLGRCVFKFMSY